MRHRTKIGAGGSWLTGYILISVAALNRKLFKKGKLSKQIAINGKSFATVDMGTYTIPDGYDLLGIIPFSSGYGDQWQVSFSEYGKKIWAIVYNYYGSSLTSTIICNVIYAKKGYFD